MIITTATTFPTVQGQLWQIISGSQSCEIVDGGRCVTDGYGDYGDNENCEVQAVQTLIMTTEQYDVEETHDFVTVKGKEYKRTGSTQGPDHVYIEPGDTWTWKSDSCYRRSGFKICGLSFGNTVKIHTCVFYSPLSHTIFCFVF